MLHLSPLLHRDYSPRFGGAVLNVILVLFTPDEAQSLIGMFSNVIFTCDDSQKTHEELTARGVEFTETPSKQIWGWWAMFKDPDGNTCGLGQRGD